MLKKAFLLVTTLLSFAFCFELAREKFGYLRYARGLEATQQRLKPGMSKDEVRQALGEPTGGWKNETGDYLIWAAGSRQGELWGTLGLATVKGHYELIVTFDGEGRVSEVFGGVN